MSFSKISTLAGALAVASKVAAHGTVTGIVADGVYYEGYHASFQYLQTQPVVVGWSIPEDLSNGFIAPDAYTNSDIICHLNATNAQTSATVAAGGTVELQWTAWPSSHHGPVIDYLANCGGDCKTVDKTALEFFKIDGVGLIDDTTIPGTWASDELIANNNSWTVTIPSDIAPGKYVLRHEIIALHSAGAVDGAQNYPQCVNLEVTGSGTAAPSGVLGTALYTETDPGIEINIYQSLSTYIVPGPTLYSGGISASQTGAVSATATAATSAAVTLVASSSKAVVTSAASSTASSAAGAVTVIAGPSSSFTHFSNSTMTTSKKSACKAKTKSSSAPLAILATSSNGAAVSTTAVSVIIPISSPGIVVATSEAASTSVEVFETATVSPVPEPATSSAPTAFKSTSGVTEPEGTTLGDLLSWISDFYNKFTGTTYSGSTVARRHSRALCV